VLSRGLPCRFPKLVNVRYLMSVHKLTRYVLWRVPTLCLAILRSTKGLFSHGDSKCGHIFLLFLWHCVWFESCVS
jgi:hypothetical protein